MGRLQPLPQILRVAFLGVFSLAAMVGAAGVNKTAPPKGATSFSTASHIIVNGSAERTAKTEITDATLGDDPDVRRAEVRATVASLNKSTAADTWASTILPYTNVTSVVTSIAAASGGVAVAVLVLIAAIFIIPGLVRGIKQGGFTINLPQIGTISIPAAVNALQTASVPPPEPANLPSTDPNRSSAERTAGDNAANAKTTQDPGRADNTGSPAGGAVPGVGPRALAGARPSALLGWSPEVSTYYSSFFQLLTASQLNVLQQLEEQPLSIDAVRSIYQNAAASRGAVSSFDEWLDYLERYGMVVTTKGRNATVSLTDRGRDLLRWCQATNHGLARLTNQNRYF